MRVRFSLGRQCKCRLATVVTLALTLVSCGGRPSGELHSELRDGDIIFQQSRSSQSMAIALATDSEWTHCGLIYSNNGQWRVFEAVQPVRSAPLDEWIARGRGGKFVVKRLRNGLPAQALEVMRKEARQYAGRDYDTAFEWDDRRMYCSELVWKIYRRAVGLEVGELQRLGDLDLSDERVCGKLHERYGNRIPYEQKIITPQAIFNSPMLETVVTAR